MSCERWVEAISAIADGEDAGVDHRLVEAHLGRCAPCREFRADVEALRRSTRVAEAPQLPDLSGRITKLSALADRARAWSAVRVLLAVVAAQIMVLSSAELVLGSQADASMHEARHLGAFGVAYSVALVVVVLRPARARSILPVAAVLAGALTVTAVVDVVEGRAPLLGEAVHVPEVLSVGLVWLLAVPAGRRGRASKGRSRPALQLLADGDDSAGARSEPAG